MYIFPIKSSYFKSILLTHPITSKPRVQDPIMAIIVDVKIYVNFAATIQVTSEV